MEHQRPMVPLERLALLVLLACLIVISDRPAQGQTKPDPRQQDAEWARQHVDLDQLPVAFTVPRGRFTIGSAMRLTPAGFPADTYSRYPDLATGITDRSELAMGVTGAHRLGPGFDGGLRCNGYRVHPFIGFHID